MTKSLLKYLTTIINWPLFSISEQSEKFLLFCRNVPINSHCGGGGEKNPRKSVHVVYEQSLKFEGWRPKIFKNLNPCIFLCFYVPTLKAFVFKCIFDVKLSKIIMNLFFFCNFWKKILQRNLTTYWSFQIQRNLNLY